MAIAYTGRAKELQGPGAGVVSSLTGNRGEPGVAINNGDGTFSNIAEDFEVAQYHVEPNGDLADTHFWLNNTGRTLVVKAISACQRVAGSDGGAVTLDVERLQGVEAPGGNGDTLLTGTHNLKSTANTVVDLTLTATTANLEIADGNRLGVNFTGTLTALAGVIVSVYMVPAALATPAES